MLNNHFEDYSLFSMSVDTESFSTVAICLNLFCNDALETIVSEQKTNHWVISLDDMSILLHVTWRLVEPGVIVICLGISFGFDLSLHSMWNWYLEKLKQKFLFWQYKYIIFVRKLTVVSSILQESHIYYVS